MTPLDLERAAGEFHAARGEARLIRALPTDATPASLADGYRVQAECARRWGGHRGWKIAAVTPEQRRSLGAETPVAARLPTPFVHEVTKGAVVRLPHRRFVRPLLECELAFRIGSDLPPRAAPYSEDEVAAAIATMHPAIEIADSRLPPGSGLAMTVADGFGNGAFVAGPPVLSWRVMDRAAVDIVLRVNGVEQARGRGERVLGDPLRAVVILANHPAPGGPGLRVGDYVTTGSLTGVTPVAPGDVAVAEFGFLSALEVAFPA